MLNDLQTVCSAAAAEVCEDVVGHHQQPRGLLLWAIDGATGLGGCSVLGVQSDAAWYANRLSQEILTQASRAERSCRETVSIAVESANAAFIRAVRRHVPVENLPSASLICARVQVQEAGFQIEVCTTGDCVGLCWSANGEPYFVASTLGAEFDAEFDALAHQLSHADDARTIHRLRSQVVTRLRAKRAEMNAEAGGYSIVAPNFDVRKLRTTRIAYANPHAAVVLMTDGAFRLVDKFGLFSWRDIPAAIRQFGVDGLVRLLRRQELEDVQCKVYARLKSSDDASIVYASFGTN